MPNNTQLVTWTDWLLTLVLPTPKPQYSPQVVLLPRGSCYAMAALRRAAEAVANASEGQRNSTLNKEAFSLLRFVQTGDLSAEQIAEILCRAALSAGLPRNEIISTLISALRARGIAA